MDLSYSIPESQQPPPIHGHPYYFHPQNQQQLYTHNPPPGAGYTYHQSPGFSVHPVQQMAQVGVNPVAAAALVALSQLVQF